MAKITNRFSSTSWLSDITDADIFGSVKYNYSINSEDDFCLGNATSAEVSFTTKKLDSSSIGNQFIYRRKEYSDSSEWVVGTFTIVEAKKDNLGMFTVTAYDDIIKFDIDLSYWLAHYD